MLQIIGWLGCAMLAVKLLEMIANPALRDEKGNLKTAAFFGLLVGWISVAIFAVWLLIQGASASQPY